MKALSEWVTAAASAVGAEVVEMDAQSITLRSGPGAPTVRLDLARLALACEGLLLPEREVRVVERVQAAVAAAARPTELHLASVLPHLRPDPDGGPWSRPLVAGHLRRCLVEDGPVTLRYIQPMDAVRSGSGIAALDRQAEDNLAKLAPQGCWVPAPEIGPGVLASRVGDGHDAARALVVGRWFADEEPLHLLVPSRDHLWVLPDMDAGAALALQPIAREVAGRSAYPLSDQVFTSVQGTLYALSRAGP